MHSYVLCTVCIVVTTADTANILWRIDPLLGNGRNSRTTGLCNSFLSNGSVNTFPWKRTRTQQYSYNGNGGVFYVARTEELS
jgi:hypothetical protein